MALCDSSYAPIAGPYTSTYGGTATGEVADGWQIITPNEQEIITADTIGRSVIDTVYQGGDCFMNVTFLEFGRASVQDIIAPFAANAGDWGNVGNIGSLGSDAAAELVLTAQAGSKAATASSYPFYTITATLAVVADSVTVDLAARLKRAPVRFRLLPFCDATDSNKIKWFKFAASS